VWQRDRCPGRRDGELRRWRSGSNGASDTESTTLNSGFNIGIGNGNQVASVIQVPIDVCGNAIGVLGTATASCVGGSTATTGGSNPGAYEDATAGGACSPTLTSIGNLGIGNGNQVASVIQVPVEVSG